MAATSRSLIEQVYLLCNDVQPFCEVLKELRESKELTQMALGSRIMRANVYISNLENCENQIPPSLRFSDVVMIADAMPCHSSEKRRLIDAFVCDVIRRVGS